MRENFIVENILRDYPIMVDYFSELLIFAEARDEVAINLLKIY